jgi:hypothetical protein
MSLPMPLAVGSTTVSAAAVAIAASTALPPRRSMASPACAASGWPVATTPRAARSGWRVLAYGSAERSIRMLFLSRTKNREPKNREPRTEEPRTENREL